MAQPHRVALLEPYSCLYVTFDELGRRIMRSSPERRRSEMAMTEVALTITLMGATVVIWTGIATTVHSIWRGT